MDHDLQKLYAQANAIRRQLDWMIVVCALRVMQKDGREYPIAIKE